MPNKSYFVSHDFNARNDQKILTLRSELGLLGYGLYWAFIETLAENDGEILEANLKGISFSLGCDWEMFQRFFCISLDVGLFVCDNGKVYSESLNKRLEYKKQKSEKAKKSAEKRWNKCETNANALQTQSESYANKTKQNKTKQKTISKDIVIEAKASPKSKEDRKIQFYDDIVDVVGGDYDIYPKDQLKKFFEYWSESGSRDKKMKFEKQKSFDIKLRLKTWLEKNEEWKREKSNSSNQPQSFREQDRQKADEEWQKVQAFRDSLKYNLIEG